MHRARVGSCVKQVFSQTYMSTGNTQPLFSCSRRQVKELWGRKLVIPPDRPNNRLVDSLAGSQSDREALGFTVAGPPNNRSVLQQKRGQTGRAELTVTVSTWNWSGDLQSWWCQWKQDRAVYFHLTHHTGMLTTTKGHYLYILSSPPSICLPPLFKTWQTQFFLTGKSHCSRRMHVEEDRDTKQAR